MKKMDKEKFMKTEVGSSLKECITAWDKALEECRRYSWGTEAYRRAKKAADECYAQWEVYKMVLHQFYGIEYCFSRTDEYFGICTEDEAEWLFKTEREEDQR